MNSALSANQFDRTQLEHLIELAGRLEKGLENRRHINLLEGYILGSLFFEPSTRTRLSFEAAMHRLGGRVITSVGLQFSSLAKGETLYDTLKMIEAYTDICVIRHPVEGASVLAARNISIPVINGGDGAGEHPTQALLDLYTISRHKNLLNGRIRVGFVGDIKYGRTIHSLLQMLAHFNVELVFISPAALRLPDRYREILQQKNIRIEETEDINSLTGCDVAYVTRVQEERFVDRNEYERFRDAYIVNRELVGSCRDDIIVMHPLPRLSEVSTDLDDHPAAVYFEQAENGLYSRMALLLHLLKVDYDGP